MIDKKACLAKIGELREISKKYNLGQNLSDTLDTLEKDVKAYHAKLVMAGRFSAGKSALLNAVMGKTILGENQGPETALASELTYSEQENCELVTHDGKVDVLPFDRLDPAKFDRYDYCVYHINSPFLRDHSDYTIVDMPGFDSSVERHNRAIAQYIGQASGYILTIDCEDGTVSGPTLDFINEVRQYHNNLVAIVTKCDKKLPADVEAVRANVETAVSDAFGGAICVIAVSSRTDDQAQLADKFAALVGTIDLQAVFDEKFGARISEVRDLTAAAVRSVKANLSSDSGDIDRKIRDNEKKISDYKHELEQKRSQLHDNLFDEALPHMMDEIQSALMSSSSALTAAALNGQESFKTTAAGIIRPVMVTALKDNAEASIEAFVDVSDFQIEEAPDGNEVAGKAVALTSKLGDIFGGKSEDTYHIITSLTAITTDLINPWLEVVVVMLPDIVNFFGKLFQKKKREELDERMRGEIIPQMIEQMRPQAENCFAQIEEKTIAGMEDKAEADVAAINETLESLKTQSAEDKRKLEASAAGIDADLAKLGSII